MRELGSDKAVIERLGSRKPLPLDNQAFSDFTECSWKKQGLLKANGQINWDEVHQVILGGLEEESKTNTKQAVDNIARGIIDPCRNVRGNTLGQTAIKVWNCLDGQLAARRSRSMRQRF